MIEILFLSGVTEDLVFFLGDILVEVSIAFSLTRYLDWKGMSILTLRTYCGYCLALLNVDYSILDARGFVHPRLRLF